jgi:outer membrane autotransporter protein
VTFSDALTHVVSLDLASGAKARFLGGADLDGGFTNEGGSFEIAAGKTLDMHGAYTSTAPGEIILGYNRSGATVDVGRLNIIGGAADISNDAVRFVVAGGSDTPEAGVISNVITGTGSGAAPASESDNSFLYDFHLVANGSNFDLKIDEANVVDAGSGNGNYARTADVLLKDLSGSSDPTINAIQTNIVNAGSEKEVEKLIESTQPSVSGGEMAGAMAFSDLSLGVSGDRLAALRTGADSGIATGDIARGLHMWAQGFGARADQDARNGVAGYDADTWGAAVGVDSDSALGGNAVIGLAFSYGNTDVDNDDAANSESSVDSYQLTLYGNADLGNAFYLNAQAAYAWNSIETDRYNVGGTGAHAHGAYDASTYAARAEIGHDISYGRALITPHATADWTHFDPDSYTETGAGGANLHVAGDSLDIIEAGFGINASRAYRTSGGSYIEPKLHADYRYNFGDDQIATSSSFTAGGPAFRTEGAEAAPNRFTVGASLHYLSVNNWDLTASYDYDFRSNYGAHAAMLRAGYKF